MITGGRKEEERMALPERTAIMLDKETRDRLEVFLGEYEGVSISDVVRSALKAYLVDKAITWEDVDFKVIPLLCELFEGYERVTVIKPDLPIEKVVQSNVPTILSLSRGIHRVDLGITIVKRKETHLIFVKVYDSDLKLLRGEGLLFSFRLDHTTDPRTRELGKEFAEKITYVLDNARLPG